MRGRTLGLCLTAVLLAAACGSSAPSSGREPSPSLHISGNRFIDLTGHPVRMRGVNWTGPAYACTHGGGVGEPLTRSAMHALLAWHINVVRIGVAEDCW